MNTWDILILLAVVAAAGVALRRVIRVRKSGGCSCGCADCPSRHGGKCMSDTGNK
mgnify:CR=1 FL=1